MPWIALVCLVVVGACRFEADYAGASVRCSDDMCPSGLECRLIDGAKVCAEKRMDAAIDMPGDTGADAIDGMPAVLTCVDPGILTSTVPVSGNTTGRTNLMTSFCGGAVQNAVDAVYRITTTAPNKQLVVSITGALSAYVINACMQTPNTAACLGSNPAAMNNPISVTAASAANYWIVVDNLNAAAAGPYTLTVTIQ